MSLRDTGPSGRDVPGGADATCSPDAPTLTAAPPPGGPGLRARSEPPGALSGARLAHFELEGLLGAGGFGEVYRARDTRLRRAVAIKVLRTDLELSAERRERLRREAIAASKLEHPNICTVHDLVEAGGRLLVVMELLEGETLHARLRRGPMSFREALPVAIQVADALSHAHRAGILHRDVKCGNVVLGARGAVKVLDFGLAKFLGTPEREAGTALESLTEEDVCVGTPGYMSPEQLLGKPVDARSDLFSLGVVLFRMVTGKMPFEGVSAAALADAVLHAEPQEPGDGALPGPLVKVILKLLRKDPEKRHANAEDVRAELEAIAVELSPARGRLSRPVRITLVASVLALAIVGVWAGHRWSRERWARGATAEIRRLVDEERSWDAWDLLREARAVLPDDPTLAELWRRASRLASIETVPPGAVVSIRPYGAPVAKAMTIGQTPLAKVPVPGGVFLVTVRKEGFAPLTFIRAFGGPEPRLRLAPATSVPDGMVPVVGGMVRLGGVLANVPAAPVDDFLIDRHEVTNEEYARFVDAGGYEDPAFWKEPFVRDGLALSWKEAVALFRDATGRPGPSTWEAGRFPRGREKHPVSGVSWFEAAAYAAFAGKSLPTAYHWTRASQPLAAALVVQGSNFEGEGTRPVGAAGSESGFGTTDMAGNVKEWCRNETTRGGRVILGGGFGEPPYRFIHPDDRTPWEREPNFGFRCTKLAGPPRPQATARLVASGRDVEKERPVSDEVFETFRRLHAYDPAPLNARVEERGEADGTRHEKVTFDAAYGDERVIAHLFLPRGVSPPYQSVVYFPGANARFTGRFDASTLPRPLRLIVESGRALVWPIYKDTFERKGLDFDIAARAGPVEYRDHLLLWSKDLRRTLDYLGTRGDLAASKTAYLGVSWGAGLAPVYLAVEPRFGAAILRAAGFGASRSLPEVEPLNYITRVKLPVLMLSDRYDNHLPVDSSQLPFFRLLGTPEKDKKRVVYESGHAGAPVNESTRESLDFLDRYLGPVRRFAAP